MELPEALQSIQRTYRRFAQTEASGISATYEAFALAVAQSDFVIEFLSGLPKAKRQPNLLFGAVRHLFGLPGSPEILVETIRRHTESIRELMLNRRTQTNEPARCAVLLPILSRLPQPLALIEVGASAGLCLLPDRYAYDYGGQEVTPKDGRTPATPIFPCRANAATEIPTTVPEVAWRMGLDLNPIDLTDEDDARWLENLIWPEQRARAERFRAAWRLARSDPPTVVKGDLLTDLEALAGNAPAEATLVVFHTAVLGYVTVEARRQFAEQMQKLDAVWVSNEAHRVFPELLEQVESKPSNGRFLLSINGTLVATTGPHGQSIDWF